MNILVTGGAGYIGSTLVPILLANGHRVYVLDNLMHGGQPLLGVWSHKEFRFTLGDIRDRETIRSILTNIDAIVHLAALVGDPACARQPELARSVNLDASLDLLAESRRCGVSRFIFASTCSNYGKMNDTSQYVDETSNLQPISLYAEAKVTVEKAVLNPSQTEGLCATSLRFATVFGVSPRMRFDLTINEFPLEMLTKKHLVIYGEEFWRPYVHVTDAARAINLVLESPTDKVQNQVFNVGSTEQNHQKQQLVNMIKLHTPDVVIEYIRKEEDPRDYRVSFTKIREVLGFETTHTVDDGIREIIQLVQDGVIIDFDNPIFRN
ncbi:NAD-dependent epimerase/dehydratase family protein [Chloroflexota bacterium]